jgi:flagellar biogenesis protein FliO
MPWLAWLRRAVERLTAGWRRHEGTRQLRLCETVALGEKRVVALVEVDGERFLIGGAGPNLTLLSKLPAARRSGHGQRRSGE